MKTLVIVILLLPMLGLAQKKANQGDINKAKQMQAEMQKQMEKELKELEATDPEAAKMAKQMMQGAMNKIASQPMPKNFSMPQSRPFGEKNTAAIQAMKDKPLSKTELQSFLSNLQTEAKKNIDAATVQFVQKQIASFNGDAEKIASASIIAWYNSSPEQAILLAINASSTRPDNLVALNNLASMLNLGGAEFEAVPLLKTVLFRLPYNPIALNNIGQSYARLGMFDSSMHYLSACLKLAPHHPEANNTAGQIEKQRGNDAKAAEYFKNSLKGAFNEAAAESLRGEQEHTNFSKLIRPRVNFPAYFNPNKYQLPAQSEVVTTAAAVKQKVEEFRSLINNTEEKYSLLKNMEEDVAKQQMQKQVATIMKNPGGPNPFIKPFSKLAMYMLGECTMRIAAEGSMIDNYVQQKEFELKALRQDFENQLEHLTPDSTVIDAWEGGHGTAKTVSCHLRNETTNAYLAKAAAINRDIQTKKLRFVKGVYEDISYWGYLAGVNKHNCDAAYYGAITQYLSALDNIARYYEIILPSCNANELAAKESEGDEPVKPECPFDINIPFLVGKIKLNCEKFSFEGGEGVVFKYEKDFESGQSTMSLGAGLDFEVGTDFLGASGKLSAGASESFYITFDANNNVTDAGLSFEANAEAAAEATVEIGKEGVGSISKEIGSTSVGGSAGYKIGVNSGLSMDGEVHSGPLSNVFTPRSFKL